MQQRGGARLELVRSSQNSTFQNVNMTGAKFQAKMLVLGASCESFAQFPRHHGSIRMAQGYVSLCVCCIRTHTSIPSLLVRTHTPQERVPAHWGHATCVGFKSRGVDVRLLRPLLACPSPPPAHILSPNVLCM